jgi:photosystem II stability/assembly factor-like uncharacterized protein
MLAVDGGYNGAGGRIYSSSNSGVIWTTGNAPVLIWTSVATSADGSLSIAVAYNAGIYISTNSGVTWAVTSAPSDGWNASASSADGTKLFAAAFDGPIYSSTNSGTTWNWTDVPALATLNTTSLRNEALLPTGYSNQFFRLKN